MRDNYAGRRGSGFFETWSLGAVVLLLALVVQLGACAGPSVNEQEAAEQGGTEGGGQEDTSQTVGVQRILDESRSFYGDTVTATGTVSEVITPVAFEMGGESSEAESTRYGEGADGLLVISDGGQAPARSSTWDKPFG
jgi:hypothetical protein